MKISRIVASIESNLIINICRHSTAVQVEHQISKK